MKTEAEEAREKRPWWSSSRLRWQYDLIWRETVRPDGMIYIYIDTGDINHLYQCRWHHYYYYYILLSNLFGKCCKVLAPIRVPQMDRSIELPPDVSKIPRRPPIPIHPKSEKIGGYYFSAQTNWRKKCIQRNDKILRKKSVNHKVGRCLARYSPRAEANNGTMQYHAIP